MKKDYLLHREIDVTISIMYFPGITHRKAKSFRLPEQMYLWKSLTTEIIGKLINFLFLLHFCEFPPALNSSNRDKCLPIREEEGGGIPHFGTPSRKDAHTVVGSLKKLFIFEEQVRWSFKNEIRRKKRNQKEVSSLSNSPRKGSTWAAPWALLLTNAPDLQEI